MNRYLALLTFTEAGLCNVEKSGTRADNFRSSVEKAGGKVIAQYWAIGRFDGCVVFESPDEQTAASLLLALGKDGNVRSQTMRLYDEAEFQSIVQKI